jgi:putative salt-induced outer membrane protein
MFKTVVALLVLATFVVAQNREDIKDEIQITKEKIKTLNENLKELQESLPKEDYAFKAVAEVGYTANSGNTDTEAFNVDAKVTNGWDLHSIEAILLMQYGTENDIESKNKLLTELLYDYKLSERLSLNYLAGYKDDKFSGFVYQFYTGPGAKYIAIKDEVQDLAVDGNLLYSKDEIEDTYEDGAGNVVQYPYPPGSISLNDGHTRSYAAYRLKGVYNMRLLENLKFHQTLSYRSEFSDLQNYFIYSKTGLYHKLTDIFSAGIVYQVDYINKPALPGKTSTDKIFTFNLIANY